MRIPAFLLATIFSVLPLAGLPAAEANRDDARMIALSPEQFGNAVFELPASVRSLRDQKPNFEPMADFSAANRYRALGRSVGRLDILAHDATGKKSVFFCTASLIAPDLLLTNHHCIPGEDGWVAEKAQFRLDYLTKTDAKGVAYPADVTPVETSIPLDFTILAVHGVPKDVHPVKLALRDPQPGEELFIIHHPAGEPQTLTRRSCRATNTLPVIRERVRHVCDTLGGSSGSLLFSDNDMNVVGLHFAGGLGRHDESFNNAKRMEQILEASPTLRKLVLMGQGVAAPSPPMPPKPAPPAPRPQQTADLGDQAKPAAPKPSKPSKPQAGTTQTTDSGDQYSPAPPQPQVAGQVAATTAGHKAGDSFTDCDGCPEMVVVPGGTFEMGSTPEEAREEGVRERFTKLERPRHKVTIKGPFAIGRFEVTRGQFAAFAAGIGAVPDKGCNVLSSEKKWVIDDKRSWRDPGFEQTENSPVVCVNWADAKAYVKWLAAKTGKGYRLASESEWEFAARGGEEKPRFWGGGMEKACDYANLYDSKAHKAYAIDQEPLKCGDGFAETAPVGSFKANKFGLQDMIGNVWEWLEDCWVRGYEGAPDDGRPWLSGSCGKRSLRGGSWNSEHRNARSAGRGGNRPESRDYDNGFRVVRDLGQ